jgi:hypothetical protein
VRSALEQFPAAEARSAIQVSEELAILKRWYYRSHKVGEIIFVKHDGEPPLRRIANAIGRVMRGDRKQEQETAESGTTASTDSAAPHA